MINRIPNLPKNNSFFLFGPRQTGKSTLIHEVFSKETLLEYNFLQTDTYLRYLAHPAQLREEVLQRPAQITHVLLDEIQKIPPLLDEVQYLLSQPRPPVFILTGSSARKLKRSEANMLAGRVVTRHLFPFTSTELGSEFYLNKALSRGTLPPVYLNDSDEGAYDILRAYVETYLREEIEVEAQVRRLDTFARFLNLAAFGNGEMIHYTNIASDVGVSSNTVKQYYQILVDTLLGTLLAPYRKSWRKRLSQHPRFYFFDTGVVRALTRQLSVPVEPKTPAFGDLFESWVVNELFRMNSYYNLDWDFSYYRTEAGAEVDLVIETPRGETLAIEIKSSDFISSSHLRGLQSFAEVCPKAKLFCVCRVPHQVKRGNILLIPWEKMWEFFTSSLSQV